MILFRNPAAVMASYGAHITRPLMRDLCYEHQLELLERMDAAGTPPVVVCSDRLQSNPEGTLRQLCDGLGLEWDPAIMTWNSAPGRKMALGQNGGMPGSTPPPDGKPDPETTCGP